MEIIIKGDPKEIAALIVELQKRLELDVELNDSLVGKIERSIAKNFTN